MFSKNNTMPKRQATDSGMREINNTSHVHERDSTWLQLGDKVQDVQYQGHLEKFKGNHPSPISMMKKKMICVDNVDFLSHGPVGVF